MGRDYESFSSLNMFKRCPRQYYYRYVKGLKQPPSGALILGGSAHEGLEFDMKEKMITKENTPTEKVKAAFADSYEKKIESNGGKSSIDWGKDKPGLLKDKGVKMIEVYNTQRSIELDPKMVEQKFELTLTGNKKIIGRIDMIETDNSMLDWKTSSRKKNQNAIDHSEQLLLYQLANKNVSELRIETLVRYKKKAPIYQVLKRPPATENELSIVKENLFQTLEAIEKGIFWRCNPDNWWCHPNYCGYYNKCKKK